jgi:hypothetical protein
VPTGVSARAPLYRPIVNGSHPQFPATYPSCTSPQLRAHASRPATSRMKASMDRDSVYSDMSISASLRDFDPERSMHNSAYSAHSNLHSSRWSAPSPAEDESEAESEGPWAPPAWQNHNNKWYRKSYLQESSPSKSRTASPYEQRLDREVTPSRIPLPESPRKGTPRTSPEPVDQRFYTPDTIASRLQSPEVEPEMTPDAQQPLEEEDAPKRDGCRYLLSYGTLRPRLFYHACNDLSLTKFSHPSSVQIREPREYGTSRRAPFLYHPWHVQGTID